MTKETLKDRQNIKKMNHKMWEIFEEYGGYEYNDEMYWQLQGLKDSFSECEDDGDIPNMLQETKETMAYFEWVVEVKKLMDREPPQLYC
tara:strand:+ start:1440 stop:1706 length:267 start_codon:yes stop_codon:yes gene_type:complete